MKKVIATLSVFLLPALAFGAAGDLTVFNNLATSIANIVGILIPLAFALALLAFFWGLVQFIFAGEEGATGAKNRMLWAVVAMFVMASVWGIVGFLGNIFGIGQGGSAQVPGIGNANIAPNSTL